MAARETRRWCGAACEARAAAGTARSRASLCAPSGALLAQRGTKPRRAAVRRRLRQTAVKRRKGDHDAPPPTPPPARKQSATRACSCCNATRANTGAAYPSLVPRPPQELHLAFGAGQEGGSLELWRCLHAQCATRGVCPLLPPRAPMRHHPPAPQPRWAPRPHRPPPPLRRRPQTAPRRLHPRCRAPPPRRRPCPQGQARRTVRWSAACSPQQRPPRPSRPPHAPRRWRRRPCLLSLQTAWRCLRCALQAESSAHTTSKQR